MKTAHIVVPVADIYKDYTFTSEVVTQGLQSEEVIILDTHNNWIKIEQWDGYKGWINHFYLGAISDKGKSYRPFEHNFHMPIKGFASWWSRSFSDSFALREGVVNDCMKFLGVPYKWGGKSPFGFDCSGLVQTAFKMNGISMPRDSKDQYGLVKNNKIMPLEYAKPGDLLFFKENGKICHVGIYDDNFHFIHCSGMVKRNSLNEEDEDDDLFDKKLMDKFAGIFSISEIIKEQCK